MLNPANIVSQGFFLFMKHIKNYWIEELEQRIGIEVTERKARATDERAGTTDKAVEATDTKARVTDRN